MLKLLALLCAVSLSGCATFKAIAVDSASCLIGQVPNALSRLEDQTAFSLFNVPGHKSWDDFASTDLIAMGVDAAKCVVQAIMHDIRMAVVVHGQVDLEVQDAYNRAEVWLTLHGAK